MRIRTQFILNMLLFGIILVGIAFSAIITNRQVEVISQQEQIATDITLEAGNLSYLSNDYVIYRKDPQFNRWQTEYASFPARRQACASNMERQALINNIRSGYAI